MITEAIQPDPLLTVKEVADRAHISKQAVYQRLDKDLASFCQLVDGKKMVKSTILDILCVKPVVQEVDRALTDALQATIDLLKGQLNKKDEQINELLDQSRNSQILMLNQQKYLPAPVADPEQPVTEPAPSKLKRRWWWK